MSFPAKQAGRSATSIWLTIGLIGCFGIARVSRSAERLQWEQKPGYRLAPLNVPKSGHSGFTLLTPEQTNLRFTNYLSYAHAQTNQNLLNGAGLAALPNLTTNTFSGATANGANAGLKASEEMQLVDSNNRVIALPSAPNSTANGFSLCTWATSC